MYLVKLYLRRLAFGRRRRRRLIVARLSGVWRLRTLDIFGQVRFKNIHQDSFKIVQ